MNPKESSHRISQFRYCSNKAQMTKALREKWASVSQDQNEDVSYGYRGEIEWSTLEAELVLCFKHHPEDSQDG